MAKWSSKKEDTPTRGRDRWFTVRDEWRVRARRAPRRPRPGNSYLRDDVLLAALMLVEIGVGTVQQRLRGFRRLPLRVAGREADRDHLAVVFHRASLHAFQGKKDLVQVALGQQHHKLITAHADGDV